MRTLLGLGLVLGLGQVSATGTAAGADEKFDAKKLVGKWEPKEAQKGGPSAMEFTKDGKMTISVDADGKSMTFSGTYKLVGEKLQLEVTVKDKEGKDRTVKDTVTLTKLTDEEMTGTGTDGKSETYRKVKAKK